MKSWLILLSGLLIWAAHFFLLYGIGEFVGSGRGARIAVAVATFGAAGFVAVAGSCIFAERPADGFAAWRRRLALAGLLLSAVAIVWQSLPALIA